jgi:hypothetical protein
LFTLFVKSATISERRLGAVAIPLPRHVPVGRPGVNKMASSPLNDVQRANFVILSLIRDAARDDAGTACCRFGLTLAQLKAISELPPEDVISIVMGMGNEALFFPRDDLDRLLKLPRSVSAVVASATARSMSTSAQRASPV